MAPNRLVLLVGTALLVVGCSTAQCPPVSRSDKYQALLTGTHEEKWALATSVRQLSEGDRRFLCSLLGNKETYYYPLVALCKAKSRQSVPAIGEGLLKLDNRYFALALGIIGDRRGIPYLRRALAGSKRDYVEEDARRALRMLGCRSAKRQHIQHASTPGLHISLTSSKQVLRLGESAKLTARVRNTGTTPVSLYKPALPKLVLVTAEGDYVREHPYAIVDDFLGPVAESYVNIKPNAEFQYYVSVSLHKIVSSDGWAPDILQEEVLYVKDGCDMGWEIAPSQEGRSATLTLAVRYAPHAHASDRARELEIEGYMSGVCTSEEIEIKCVNALKGN